MLKTIKSVDEKTRHPFKSLAAARGTTMGSLPKSMVEDYEKKSHYFWDVVLNGEKILSDLEAEELN